MNISCCRAKNGKVDFEIILQHKMENGHQVHLGKLNLKYNLF
jgi:hypothetical protein